MLIEERIKFLKIILDNLRTPERLDTHPWVNSLFVYNNRNNNLNTSEITPGKKLAEAVCSIFIETMPVSPPKQGKRLDTRWGKFGILASQYFAPYQFGVQWPESLREAWGGIDQAILLYKFGPTLENIPQNERNSYILVSNEPEITPISTISDWHVRGIDQLAGVIDAKEENLRKATPIVEKNSNKIGPNLTSDIKPKFDFLVKLPHFVNLRWVGWIICIILFWGLFYSGLWGWQIFQQAQVVRNDLSQLQELSSGSISIEKLRSANAQLTIFHTDLGILREQSSPVLRIVGPILAWFPVYGNDIAYSADLMEFADSLSGALQSVYQAASPFLEPGVIKYNPQLLTKLLVSSQPELQLSKQQLESALTIQARFRGVKFSPRIKAVFDRIDPLLPKLNDGLTLGIMVPSILGAGTSGPKTYMLLVQNEDELRPTGGFITSVGSFVIKNGNMFGLQFQEAGDLEDWSLPYPNAPWQLAKYMNSPVLVLRDANWFTDYPTAVSWIEFLYAYNHKNTVDGVIAFNQQALVELLRAIGPVKLDGVAVLITADDVIDYMRAAKTPPSPIPANFYRKAFISQIAEAVMQKLLSGDGIDWQKMAAMFSKTLDEHNVMLQFDDTQLTDMIAKYGWDGAVRPGNGDFFMAVDTNVGFNKTNAVVDRKMNYDVDLTDLTKPTSTLVIFTSNHANSTASCVQWGEGQHPIEQSYPINYCYWNYMRIYVPSGAKLDSATPHAVPADWVLLGEQIPARVDTIEENIPEVNGYGTMMVIPEGQTLDTSFKFQLSSNVVGVDTSTNIRTYSLKIKKQPGVIEAITTIRIHLPANAKILGVSPNAQVDGQNIQIETDMRTDEYITVTFSQP